MGLSIAAGLRKWDRIFLAILAIGAVLLFFRLDHRPFWQDEAETACLARNVISYGLPRAFDGVNLISQEEGRDFNANYLWHWSPWLQIYVAAAAFAIGGFTTTVGRFPFALFGLACIFLVYLAVWRNFADLAWSRIAAALLTFSVPFLLFSRQCRYYSLGALLALTIVYAFRKNPQLKLNLTLLIVSLGLLFYTNYLLFISFVFPTIIAAILVYQDRPPLKRLLKLILLLILIMLPGVLLFRVKQQSNMLDILMIFYNLEKYFADLFQLIIPLPLVLYLIWRWRRAKDTLKDFSEGEKFVLFLFLIILGNIIILSPVPQTEHRYLVHLYPLAAIILGWLVCLVWRYHKFSGALLALLLLFTNWLYIVPMDWLGIPNRPNPSTQMLTYPNVPLELYLRELSADYPDINRSLIRFFQANGQIGDTILTNYDDLPLQFYTSYRVVGGLQGHVPAGPLPDWVVKHPHTQWNRQYELQRSEDFIKRNVLPSKRYKAVYSIYEDEVYGNIPDPYHHRFIPPTQALAPLTIYQKISDN